MILCKFFEVDSFIYDQVKGVIYIAIRKPGEVIVFDVTGCKRDGSIVCRLLVSS